MPKVITLTGLDQVDELSKGKVCTPVEDATMAGDKVIRCKEDVVQLDKAAPPKAITLSGVKKTVRRRRRRNPGHHLGSIDKPCVPEWVAIRTKLGKTMKRCHCGNRFLKNDMCKRKG